jgi:hypothetical protein
VHLGLLCQDVPRFAVEFQRRRDELRTVDHRATADCKEKVDLLVARERNRFHQGFVGGIRFDATEYKPGPVTKRRLHLCEHAVALDAPAAEGNQNACLARHVSVKCFDLAFAE